MNELQRMIAVALEAMSEDERMQVIANVMERVLKKTGSNVFGQVLSGDGMKLGVIFALGDEAESFVRMVGKCMEQHAKDHPEDAYACEDFTDPEEKQL